MLCAQVLRSTSPPLAAMTAQETALAGSFRAAHQRLVASAEEVAVSGGAVLAGSSACSSVLGRRRAAKPCYWAAEDVKGPLP